MIVSFYGTNDKHDITKNLIEQEINAVMMMPTRVRENGCVACHILFTLVNRMGISEASASDQLSEILTHDQNLNEKFIDAVEKIHMKQRMMSVSFSLKSRDSKNRYINSQMKDGLYELDIDLVNYGKDIVMRKLLITYLSLQLAQSIGVDHHAAKEELYYYMRTKDNETHTMLTEFMDHFYEKVCKGEESGSDNVT
jgi:hypothetical protein